MNLQPITHPIQPRPLIAGVPLHVFAILLTRTEHLIEWLRTQELHQAVAYTIEEAVNITNIKLNLQGKNPNDYTLTSSSAVTIPDILSAMNLTEHEIRSIFRLPYYQPTTRERKEIPIKQFIYNLRFMADKYADAEEKKVVEKLIDKLKNVG